MHVMRIIYFMSFILNVIKKNKTYVRQLELLAS